MADMRIAVGETTPPFDVTLERDDGEVADLSSASVQFYLIKYGQTFIDGEAATVLDAPNGSVRYSWQAGDLTETGVYAAIFKATYAGPSVEYFEYVIEVTDGVGVAPSPPPPAGPTYVNSVNGRTGVVVGVLDTANNLSDVASASLSRDNLGLGDSATLDVGTTAGTVAAGDDSRLTDSRTPTGPAGGVLAGTYPDPTFAADMATQAELDAGLLTRNRLHGFPNRTDSTITFVPGARLFTIAPTGASFDIHVNGTLYTKSGPESVTVTAVDGPHYVYYNSAGVLTHSTTPWNLLTDISVALVVWSTTANTGFMCEERHGDTMDAATHDYLHATRGTQLKARPALSGYTLSPGAPADADNTMAVSGDGILADEDLYSSLAAVSDGGGANGYSVLWRTGAAEWTWTTGLTVPFVNTAAGYINANTLSGTWGQTQLANNQYVNYWVLAVPAVSADARYQYFFIPGQQIHTSLANAQAESVGASLVLTGLPFTEFAFTHRLTFRTSNTYTSTGKCRLEGVTVVVESVANITAATATAAASVTNVPAGNIAATNVQAALNELDTEKVAKAGDTFTGTLAGTLAAATTDAFTTAVTADTNPRLVLNADGKIEWGPGNATQDVTLYRSAADTLKTDDKFRPLFAVTDPTSQTFHSMDVTQSLTADNSNQLAALTVNHLVASGSNAQTGTVRGAYFLAGSSSSYTGTMTLAECFIAQNAVVAGSTITTTRGVSVLAPSGSGTITNSVGVNIANQGRAGTTSTVGLAISAQSGSASNYSITVGASSTYTLWLSNNTDSTTAAGGITFGTSADTNLYRSAADVLKTDDSLYVVLNAGVGTAPVATSLLTVGGTPTSTSSPQIAADVAITGNGSPTNMYGLQIAVTTAASSTVTTAQGFRVVAVAKGSGGTLTNAYGFTITPQTAGTNNYSAVIGASSTATLWLSYDANNTNAEAGIVFGSSRDTNLYRSAANELKTDDAFVVGGAYVAVGTNPATTGSLRLPNNSGMYTRNAANTADIQTFFVSASDNTNVNAVTGKAVQMLVNGTTVAAFGGTLFTLVDAINIAVGTTTGTKIGTATSQKLSLWNATPIVQPTTAVAAATFVANTSGIVNDTATFDGYTIGQVVKALRNIGALA